MARGFELTMIGSLVCLGSSVAAVFLALAFLRRPAYLPLRVLATAVLLIFGLPVVARAVVEHSARRAATQDGEILSAVVTEVVDRGVEFGDPTVHYQVEGSAGCKFARTESLPRAYLGRLTDTEPPRIAIRAPSGSCSFAFVAPEDDKQIRILRQMAAAGLLALLGAILVVVPPIFRLQKRRRGLTEFGDA
jgi:hypothetical protein